MDSNLQAPAQSTSLPPVRPNPPAPAAPGQAKKQSPPWASLSTGLRAVSIYHLTLALLLLDVLAAWLVIAPASRPAAILNLVIASAVCAGAEAVLGRWAGPYRLWPSRPKPAAPASGPTAVPAPSAPSSALPSTSAPPSPSPAALAQSKRVWCLSQTSLICGLIIGSILMPETSPLVVAAIALLAILIKRLVHDGPFPIFNPAAAALVVGGLAFGTLDIWWASVPSGAGLVVLLAAILLLSWKQNRWLIEIAFLAAWLASWALLQHLPPLSASLATLNVLLGVLPLFLMAFMLFEPKTSPLRPKQQLIYGALAALAAVFLLSVSSITDMALAGLLVANLAKKGMEKFKLAL